MLNVRTNVLLDQETRKLLTLLAKKEKTSIGELIRRAVDLVYKKKEEEEVRKRIQLVKKIYEWQKKIKMAKTIDYRALIEYGRRR